MHIWWRIFKWLYPLLLILFSLSNGHASAQGKEGFWSLQLENDLWGSQDDRFYTHGTKFSFATIEEPPQHLKVLADFIPWYRSGEKGLFGMEMAQTIFTPEDIKESVLLEDDRPYAGWLYFNIGLSHIYRDQGNRDWMNFLGYTLGVVGPASLAEQTQTFVHEALDGDDPNGWSNQLHNEPGINLFYLNKFRRIFDFDEALQQELGYHWGFIAGNVYTLGSAGFLYRYGTHLKADIGPPSIAPGFSGVPAFNPNRQTHWYLFAGFEARAIGRNIFLDGNTFRDSHSVDKMPFVGDIQLGFAFHFDDMRLSFVQMFRSREFDQQEEPVQYGAINLTYYFDHR